MTRPIKPSEVAAAKKIPDEVFEAFNELIAENFVYGRATVTQDKAVKRILAKMPDVTSGQLFERGWLDVEDAYREQGWKVAYDKPAYNETYEASFEFAAPPKRSTP